MPSHRETQFLPYSVSELFALVADIEKYPEFLPWCRAARVLERGENEMLGELVICFKHICERYTSRVLLTPAEGNGSAAIDVSMVKGPFEHLINEWRFTPVPEGTRLDFYLDFKFRSVFLDKLIGLLFSTATQKMVHAFHARAKALYGQGRELK